MLLVDNHHQQEHKICQSVLWHNKSNSLQYGKVIILATASLLPAKLYVLNCNLTAINRAQMKAPTNYCISYLIHFFWVGNWISCLTGQAHHEAVKMLINARIISTFLSNFSKCLQFSYLYKTHIHMEGARD